MTFPVRRTASVRRVLVVLTVLAVAGCGGAAPSSVPTSDPAGPTAAGSRPAPPRFAIVGPLVTVSSEPGAVRATALVQGVLGLRGDCVTVGGNAVVWPDGVTWDGGSSSVVAADGTRFSLGEEFVGGGGWTSPATLEALGAPEGVLAAVQECLSEPGGAAGSGEVAIVEALGPPRTVEPTG